MKQNLVVLLADLFNLFEIHPAKCVAYPGMDQQLSSKFIRLNILILNYSSNQNVSMCGYRDRKFGLSGSALAFALHENGSERLVIQMNYKCFR